MRKCRHCGGEYAKTPTWRLVDQCRTCWNRLWWERHPEQLEAKLAKLDDWRKSHPERVRATQRRSDAKRGSRSEYQSVYRASRLPRFADYMNRRRAKKLSNGVIPYNREDIWNRDGRACIDCKKPLALKDMWIGHLVPISKGGPDAPDNVACQCRSCNQKQGRQVHPLSH